MATDFRSLVRDYLDTKSKVHLIGHDIGGMVEYAYASRYSDEVASVVWGECPLPGTRVYEAEKSSVTQFHFCVPRRAGFAGVPGRGAREGVSQAFLR
jgi:pimeloyl-ACP methyl ester carboxylesterase